MDNTLSTILDYYTRTMLTAIENNIKLHFDYLRRFVNSYFKNTNIRKQLKDHTFKKQIGRRIIES